MWEEDFELGHLTAAARAPLLDALATVVGKASWVVLLFLACAFLGFSWWPLAGFNCKAVASGDCLSG